MLSESDWSREEYLDEVVLVERFDVVEDDVEDETENLEYDADDNWWSDVEQGRYDDDPSPYDGNYSEE
jgi:hypothetical protein